METAQIINRNWWNHPSAKATAGAGAVMAIAALSDPQGSNLSDGRPVADYLGAAIGGTLAASIFAIIFALLLAGVMSIFKKPFKSTFSRAFQYTVVAVSVLSLVGNSMLRSDRNRKTKASEYREKEAVKNLISDMQNEIKSSLNENNRADAGLAIEDSRTASRRQKSFADDCASLRKLVTSHLEKFVDFSNRYTRKLDDDGLNDLLDMRRIERDRNLVESKSILFRSRKTVLDSREEAFSLIDDLPKLVRKFDWSPGIDEAVADGIAEGMRKAVPILREGWDLEVKILDKMEAVITHLELTSDKWIVDGGKLFFEEDLDLAVFNNLLKDLTNLSERQTSLKTSGLQSAMQRLDKIKEELE